MREDLFSDEENLVQRMRWSQLSSELQGKTGKSLGDTVNPSSALLK